MSTEDQSRLRAAHLHPTSVLAMLLYSVLLLAGFVYALG